MDIINGLNGKKILFLAPKFFGYEVKIKDKLEQMGAQVNFYDERSVTKAFDRALLKIMPSIFYFKTKSYYNNILHINQNIGYDYIFIIKCDMITRGILKKFRSSFKNAKFCLYLWDSIDNIKGIAKKFIFFDKILSFDRKDVNENSLIKFRPLFYTDDYKMEVKRSDDYKYDLSFCGTLHSDRYKIIHNVIQICNEYKLRQYIFCYLQSEFIYYFYKLFKREFKKTKAMDFNFTKLESNKISNIIDASKVILDIQHPNQTGLTIRTIEMIGMNKKLITTNAEIKNYDFYNPKNILLIDRKKIIIPYDFFKMEYEILDEELYKKYSIESWLQDILLD